MQDRFKGQFNQQYENPQKPVQPEGKVTLEKTRPSIQTKSDGVGDYVDEVDVLYALSTGLVSAYLKNQNNEALENLLKYTLDLKSEFAVMIVQDLQRVGVDMQRSQAFKEWVKKFAYLLA